MGGTRPASAAGLRALQRGGLAWIEGECQSLP
jgi:hypothetical protein